MEVMKFKAVSGEVEAKAVPLRLRAVDKFEKGINRATPYVRPDAPEEDVAPVRFTVLPTPAPMKFKAVAKPEVAPRDPDAPLLPLQPEVEEAEVKLEPWEQHLADSHKESVLKLPEEEFDLSESVKGFLIELEDNVNKMYVPAAKDSKSGATIAKGVDLGQFSEDELKTNVGLDKDLLAKLKPYLGLKKEAAEKFVKENPLTLSDEEVNELNSKIGKYTLKKLERDFKKFVGRDLSEEPREVQQGLLAAYYNLGDNLFEYTKKGKKIITNFTGELKEKRYKDAAKNLSTWNESDLTGLRKRRRLEAELMSGTLKTENARARSAEILKLLREG